LKVVTASLEDETLKREREVAHLKPLLEGQSLLEQVYAQASQIEELSQSVKKAEEALVGALQLRAAAEALNSSQRAELNAMQAELTAARQVSLIQKTARFALRSYQTNQARFYSGMHWDRFGAPRPQRFMQPISFTFYYFI
jgi:hypothetical protein